MITVFWIEVPIGAAAVLARSADWKGVWDMIAERFMKESFCVIGKEGSAGDDPGFIRRLWADANAHFAQIAPLAKKNGDGSLTGIWGAMTDFSRSFRPWEDGFSRGLYLAGVECREDALPPEGWTKWTVPSYEYLKVECDSPAAFWDSMAYLEEKGIPLAGAVQDFTCPRTGKSYMCFPVKKL